MARGTALISGRSGRTDLDPIEAREMADAHFASTTTWNDFVERHPWVVLDPDGEHYTRFTNERQARDHADAEGGTVVAPGWLAHEDVR